MGQVLAFVSGKGGTGKTSLCAAVASCLAARGSRVLCVDLDVGLRNLDIALGLPGEALLPFTELCSGAYSPEQLTEHPGIPGLYLLTAPVNCGAGDIDASAFAAFLEAVRPRYDFILLDAPAGVGTLFRMAAASADLALLVTGGDKATLRDGARAARLLDGVPASLIVNRLRPDMFRKMRATVDDLMDEVGLPLLGLVPEDETVPLAAAGETPLVLASRKGAAAACLRISRRLCGEKVPLSRR